MGSLSERCDVTRRGGERWGREPRPGPAAGQDSLSRLVGTGPHGEPKGVL